MSPDFSNFSNNTGINPENESVTGNYSGTTIKSRGTKKVIFSVSGVKAIDVYVINGNATDNRSVNIKVNGDTYSGTPNVGSWKESFSFSASDEQTIELTASGDLRLYAIRFFVDNPIYVQPKCKQPLYKIGAYSLYTDLYPITFTTFSNDNLWYKINEDSPIMVSLENFVQKDSLMSETRIYAKKNDSITVWTTNDEKLNSDSLTIVLPEPIISGSESMAFTTFGSDLDYEAISYTIPGKFISGGSNNALKIRTFRGNVKILVNEGYNITNLNISLASSDANLAFSNILVDGNDILEGTNTVNNIGNINIDYIVKDSIVFVFDETIDHSSSQFTMSVTANYKLPEPILLYGDIEFIDTDKNQFVYDSSYHTPEWIFTEEKFSSLIKGVDYIEEWSNNKTPGTATLSVNGIGNYKGTIEKTFQIYKAPLNNTLFSITLPDNDIVYDENEHRASVIVESGVGEVKFTYTIHGETEALSNAPVNEGHYDIYCEIAEGDFYYGKAREYIGSFSIYRFDEIEWQSLSLLYAELQQMGVTLPWDTIGGAKNVGKYEELTVKEGHVVGVSLTNKGMVGLFPSSLISFAKLEDLDLSNNNLSGDVAGAIAAAKVQNPLAFNSLKTLDISDNLYHGNLGVLANCMPSLTGLNASHNKFEDLYPELPATITDLDISNQHMERVVELNMSNLSLEDLSTKVPTILLYDQVNRVYRNSINLLCTKADLSTFNKYDTDEWAMQLQIEDNQISIPYVSAQNAYHGESGDTLNVLNMIDIDATDGCSFRIALSFSEGDANFDGKVNVLDLQTTINYMFE